MEPPVSTNFVSDMPDPYVKFAIGKREEKCSRVVQSTVNPVWDENLELTIMDPGREIVDITVYEYEYHLYLTILAKIV